MKKIFFLAVIIFAGYKFHQNGFSFSPAKGAVDKNGNAMVVLIVGPGCGDHCDKIRSQLKKRGVSYEEIDVAGSDGAPVSNKYGINRYPTTLIGSQEILGDDIMRITAALAETYGKDVLTHAEKIAMDKHYDDQGRAKVVMYGTNWCGYCKQQREFFAANNIAFDDINVEASDSGNLSYQTLQGAGYPLTYVGYRRFSGYKGKEILAAVDELSKIKREGAR